MRDIMEIEVASENQIFKNYARIKQVKSSSS